MARSLASAQPTAPTVDARNLSGAPDVCSAMEVVSGGRAASVRGFFVLAFAFTWALQIPGVLAREGLLPGNPDAYLPFVMLGIFGPMVAAVLQTARAEGRAGVRRLFGRLARWRIGPQWVAIALLLPGLLLAGGLVLMQLAGYEGSALLLPEGGRWVAIPIIAIAEEVGWRGYALPRLKARYGAFVGSVALGVLWALWHIPMFLGMDVPLTLMPVMLLFFVGGSLFYTWLVERTGGSLLIAVLAHVGAHLENAHLALPGDTLPLLVGTVVYAGLGVALVYLDRRTFPLTFPPRPSGPTLVLNRGE